MHIQCSIRIACLFLQQWLPLLLEYQWRRIIKAKTVHLLFEFRGGDGGHGGSTARMWKEISKGDLKEKGVLTLCSSFWMIFLPPLRAWASASSSLTCMSLIWLSRALRSFSTWSPDTKSKVRFPNTKQSQRTYSLLWKTTPPKKDHQ